MSKVSLVRNRNPSTMSANNSGEVVWALHTSAGLSKGERAFFRGDLPARSKIAMSSRISALAKYIIVLFFANVWFIPLIPSRWQGGVWPIVTGRGAGCDGRDRLVRRATRERTAKACGPGALVAPLGQKPG